MKRTQIYFPQPLYQDLKIESKAMKVTVSEYIRMIMAEKLYTRPLGKDVAKKKAYRLSLLAKKAVSFGKKDLARNFNKYFEASLS